MPRLTFVLKSVAALSLAAILASPATIAQAAPTDIPGVMAVCGPVISEEYDGDRDRWGECVAAVGGFLDYIGAPSEETNTVVADLVAALVELYEQARCTVEDTELPQAIELAAQKSTDDMQQAQIIEISATIKDCAVFATAAIPVSASTF